MKINIASNEVVHFIGIGGIGMSGLAQIMSNMGFAIQGSDLSKNKNKLEAVRKNMKKNYSNDVYSVIENQIKEFIWKWKLILLAMK